MPSKPKPVKKEDLTNDYSINNIHDYSISPSSREIYLHGHYQEHEEPGVEYRMASTFLKNLHYLERQNSNPIIVHMMTIGGEWNDGMAIYDAIQLSPCPVVLIAHAHARSMSSIIPQSADLRIIMPSADFMIHYGSIALSEVSTAAKSSIDWNERASKKMLNIYLSRCKEGEYFVNAEMSDKQIINLLDKKMRYHTDWWISAEESVNYGFMDGIMGTKGFENIGKLVSLVKKRKV